MNTVSDQFWPIVATVIPVLALAMIVEVRSTIEHWDADFPWGIRSIQGLAWFGVLIQFAIIEIVAFNNLASSETSTSWVFPAKLSIATSIITLIIVPALSILAKSNIHIFASAMTRAVSASDQWQLFRLSRHAKRNLRRVTESKGRPDALMAQVVTSEQKILSGEHPDGLDCQQKLSETLARKRDINNEIEAAKGIKREATETVEAIKNEKEKLRIKRKEFIARIEKEVAEAGDWANANPPRPDGTTERASEPGKT